MGEVLTEYEATISDKSGREYIARACGWECEDGHWEGWLEFVPMDGGVVVRSARETTQPNRMDTAYWATGLTRVYLEGALARALEPVEIARRVIDVKPAYEGPAPERPVISVSGAAARRARPVLNPFLVYEQGEDVLRAELGALDGPRLRDIIRGFSLVNGDTAELMRDTEAELTDVIIASVRERSLGHGAQGDRQTGIVSAEG